MKMLAITTVFISLIAWSYGENVNLFISPSSESTVVKYRVKRAVTSGGPYLSIGEVAQSAAPMFTDAAVDLTNPQYYVVTVVDGFNQESPISNEVQAQSITLPAPPSATTITITVQ
jgi:fibronectin type 3 domain-containing protein